MKQRLRVKKCGPLGSSGQCAVGRANAMRYRGACPPGPGGPHCLNDGCVGAIVADEQPGSRGLAHAKDIPNW